MRIQASRAVQRLLLYYLKTLTGYCALSHRNRGNTGDLSGLLVLGSITSHKITLHERVQLSAATLHYTADLTRRCTRQRYIDWVPHSNVEHSTQHCRSNYSCSKDIDVRIWAFGIWLPSSALSVHKMAIGGASVSVPQDTSRKRTPFGAGDLC